MRRAKTGTTTMTYIGCVGGRDATAALCLPASLPLCLSPRQPTGQPTQVARRARCTLNKQRHTFVPSLALSLARSPRIWPEGSKTRHGYEINYYRQACPPKQYNNTKIISHLHRLGGARQDTRVRKNVLVGRMSTGAKVWKC